MPHTFFRLAGSDGSNDAPELYKLFRCLGRGTWHSLAVYIRDFNVFLSVHIPSNSSGTKEIESTTGCHILLNLERIFLHTRNMFILFYTICQDLSSFYPWDRSSLCKKQKCRVISVHTACTSFLNKSPNSYRVVKQLDWTPSSRRTQKNQFPKKGR